MVFECIDFVVDFWFGLGLWFCGGCWRVGYDSGLREIIIIMCFVL